MGTEPEVRLRHVELSDVDRLLAWMGDERVSFISSDDPRRSRGELRDYLGNTIALPHRWLRAICVQGKLVGYVSVTPRSGTKRCCGRGLCGIARECWGREAAPAAVRMAAAEAFAEFPQLERLEVLVAAENAAGQSVMDKAGFVKEAVHRRFYLREGKPLDVARFALVRAESKL